MTARQPRECAIENTVVGTVASASYLVGLRNLATTAHRVGFPCIVVQPFDWFDELRDNLLASLPVASPPLLPRPKWCDPNGAPSVQYGWRRSQLYRVRLWRVVLELGLDLLAMDLDHEIGTNPSAFLRAVRAPEEKVQYARKGAQAPVSTTAPADVVAMWDGPRSRYLNVGIMWLRSTNSTRLLTRRAENRTFSGWEQEIFNEEINFNQDLAGVRCCHTICIRRLAVDSKVRAKLPRKDQKSNSLRAKIEGHAVCSTDQPYAIRPPHGSAEHWVRLWNSTGDTPNSKHLSNRRYGRCNHRGNVCRYMGLDGKERALNLTDPVGCMQT